MSIAQGSMPKQNHATETSETHRYERATIKANYLSIYLCCYAGCCSVCARSNNISEGPSNERNKGTNDDTSGNKAQTQRVIRHGMKG